MKVAKINSQALSTQLHKNIESRETLLPQKSKKIFTK